MSDLHQPKITRQSQGGDETILAVDQIAVEQLAVENDAQPFELSGLKLITVMTGLALAIFLMSLDSSIIATAVPHITSEFKSAGDTAWYGSAYTLSLCALQPIAGKLNAKFSLKVSSDKSNCDAFYLQS